MLLTPKRASCVAGLGLSLALTCAPWCIPARTLAQGVETSAAARPQARPHTERDERATAFLYGFGFGIGIIALGVLSELRKMAFGRPS